MKFAWLCSHESYQPEDLVRQAVAAEEAGFDVVLGSDHFHPWVDDTSAAGFVWSWLGAVAARTARVQLGTSVTCPLFHYHPALVAQMAATTDRLSGGRLLLGVGTGEALNERPLGFPFPGYAERQARMQEALEIIHRLFAGEKLSFRGEHYTTETARLYSPPAGDLPVLMAAGGPKSAEFAGTYADGLITSVKDPADTVAKVIAPYRRAAAARRARQLVLATRWTVLAGGPSEAWKALSSLRGLRAPGRLEATDPAELRIRADEMDPEEVLASYAVVPDAAGLIEAYRPLVTDVGADIVSIQVMSEDPMAAVEMIGKEVLPQLRAVAG
ncbi:TIGR03557 family F420-dependent LLM class oxidoreductase [Trebonia sp.]|uniref:TIGR03557 family F420-dependent LLM class oxidoreductase n=1 Tax=Trebonia sp. TaxID=2767075 RepID=UPI00260AB8E4|nr:TIGR03557 family F420-dependent LLM class oxidoreductase [Trebonia sp.]